MLTSAQKRELEDLIAAGQKIAAVKRYRELTSVGLAEAVHAVEQLRSPTGGAGAGAGAPSPARSLDAKVLKEAEAAAMAAIRDGNAIEAIKRYRSYTNLGLKESKDAIDALSVVHRTEGRIDGKLARALLAAVAAGRKEEAITLLITSKGYEEAEARAFVSTLGGAGIAGCLRVLLALVLFLIAIGVLVFLLT